MSKFKSFPSLDTFYTPPTPSGIVKKILQDYVINSTVKAILPKKNTNKGMPPQARRRRNRPQRNRGSRRSNRRPRRRPMPWARATTLRVKKVVTFAASRGSNHRWFYDIKYDQLIGNFKETYAEFKVMNFRASYLPNSSTSETGLYVSVLADKDGFGDYGPATAVSWFPSLCSFPGAKIRPRYVGCSHYWRPTEPSEREWHNRKADFHLATIYVCNNGAESDVLGGMIMIDATLKARGFYYDGKVLEHEIGPDGAVQPTESLTLDSMAM